jgi:hypothetical protein
MVQNLAERLCWDVALRDDSRAARPSYRKPLVNGMYRPDKGALLDDFFYFLPELAVLNLMNHVQGKAVLHEVVPFVQYLLLYGLKILFTVDRMNALPAWLFSDEAFMRLVGFKA